MHEGCELIYIYAAGGTAHESINVTTYSNLAHGAPCPSLQVDDRDTLFSITRRRPSLRCSETGRNGCQARRCRGQPVHKRRLSALQGGRAPRTGPKFQFLFPSMSSLVDGSLHRLGRSAGPTDEVARLPDHALCFRRRQLLGYRTERRKVQLFLARVCSHAVESATRKDLIQLEK